eukprot:TRINITY_DN9587_c0_g1_i3.p2 TRINITY_DN9587_c0_g1~~TRINITY_DN9587_c0_g1_i3.p2  ORF type:complete len:225 (-),score=44.15 TRINITY_DN9587_c0_g1_i3:253-927(-)
MVCRRLQAEAKDPGLWRQHLQSRQIAVEHPWEPGEDTLAVFAIRAQGAVRGLESGYWTRVTKDLGSRVLWVAAAGGVPLGLAAMAAANLDAMQISWADHEMLDGAQGFGSMVAAVLLRVATHAALYVVFNVLFKLARRVLGAVGEVVLMRVNKRRWADLPPMFVRVVVGGGVVAGVSATLAAGLNMLSHLRVRLRAQQQLEVEQLEELRRWLGRTVEDLNLTIH